MENALELHKLAFGYADSYMITSYLYMGLGRPKIPNPNHAWVNHIPVLPVKVKLALEHAEILRPAHARFDIIEHEPLAAFYILDPPYKKTETFMYKGRDAVGVFPAIERICKTARGVMLFCAAHELEKYAPLLPDGELEIVERRNVFKGHSMFEACLCNWCEKALDAAAEKR